MGEQAERVGYCWRIHLTREIVYRIDRTRRLSGALGVTTLEEKEPSQKRRLEKSKLPQRRGNELRWLTEKGESLVRC